MAAEVFWDEAWSHKDYEWPTTVTPAASVVNQLAASAAASGGRALIEAHADRGVTMDFPNGAIPGTRIRKQVPRTECRRQAQVMAPVPPDLKPALNTPQRENSEPLKVCLVCDAVHLWPRSPEA